jgi:hypothetical protein
MMSIVASAEPPTMSTPTTIPTAGAAEQYSKTTPTPAPPGTVIAWRWQSDPARPYPTRTIEDLTDFDSAAAAGAVRLSRYGGWLDRPSSSAGTGFFRAEKVGDRWWLVDPDGYRYFAVAMNALSTGRSPQTVATLPEKFGSPEAWRDRASEWMWELGFNGTGAWSSDKLLRGAPRRLPYCPTFSFMSRYGKKRGGTYAEPGHTGYPNKCMFVFDPEFAIHAEEYAKQIAPLRDDPYLFGYFTDNELPIPADALDRFLQLPENDHGRKAAETWFKDRTGRAAPAVPPPPAVKPKNGAPAPPPPPGITPEDREAFQAYVVDRYLRIVCGAIRKHDPNHIILGPRFYGDERRSPRCFEVIGKYCDVIAVNLYHVWTPGEEVRDWEKWSGRPSMITEWYAKGMDSGLPNISGAGYTVYTQDDRGKFYQNFTLALIESKASVGWHWFKYMDNDPTDPKAELSNKDSNKGIVTAGFEPHEPIIRRMRDVNRAVYPLIEYFDAPGGR